MISTNYPNIKLNVFRGGPFDFCGGWVEELACARIFFFSLASGADNFFRGKMLCMISPPNISSVVVFKSIFIESVFVFYISTPSTRKGSHAVVHVHVQSSKYF